MRPKSHQSLARGAAVVFGALAVSLAPPPEVTVAEWAQAERKVSADSGSPHPGDWDNGLVPYGVEPMSCLSLSDPCHEVIFKKSHQIAGTEFGINLIGYVIDQEPSPIAVVLPTLEEVSKYEKIKLQPTIDATPALRHKVKRETSRGREGSTVTFKRFRGGYVQITGANSSTGLQMISVRVLIAEEISEWPDSTGNRGDPLEQAENRLTAWKGRGVKKYLSSTPSLKGICRISAKYEASDQRRCYVPCPQCGTYQVLKWENVKWRSDHAPHGAYMVCADQTCGGVIEHYQKRAMVAAGVWIKTYPDKGAEPGDTIRPEDLEHHRARPSKGRQPGFFIWQAYSPFPSWDDAVARFLEAQGNQEKEKNFIQQVLGEAYEESGEAPDHEKLFDRREAYKLGSPPPGVLALTGMADVQGNRIEWGVYGWGIGVTGWLVDMGVVEGDPSQAETWRKMDAVVSRTYELAGGRRMNIEAFGVDAGYLSNMVYLFSREYERVFALDGRDGHTRPMVGKWTAVTVNWRGKPLKGGALLWPTGTWPLKSNIYGALRKTVEGPDEDGIWPLGALHYPDACDQEFFKQLTAEYLKPVERNGRPKLIWVQPKGQANEQLDIAVGARAMAYHLGLDNLTRDQWAALAAERGAPPETVQRDLADLWAPKPGQEAEADQPADTPRTADQDISVKRAHRMARLNQ